MQILALLSVGDAGADISGGGEAEPGLHRGEGNERFREWIEAWAKANNGSVVEWGTAELETPGVVDLVALVCERETFARGAHLVMRATADRFVARFDDDPDHSYGFGPCRRPARTEPPRFRQTRERSVLHAVPVRRAGSAETRLAIREGQLVVIAEHGDMSARTAADPGVNWDARVAKASRKRHASAHRRGAVDSDGVVPPTRWPRAGSYTKIVCERVP